MTRRGPRGSYWLSIMLLFALPQATQQAPNGRVAALRHALAAGFEVPREGLVVMRDGYFKDTHGPGEQVSAVTQAADAEGLAKLVSPSAKVLAAENAMTCRKDICAPAGEYAVLIVKEPVINRSGVAVVAIQLYSRPPAGTRGDAILDQTSVEVRRTGSGWTAVTTRLVFPRTTITLPPP